MRCKGAHSNSLRTCREGRIVGCRPWQTRSLCYQYDPTLQFSLWRSSRHMHKTPSVPRTQGVVQFSSQPSPSGMGSRVQRGCGGGGCQFFFWFCAHFSVPRFVLSILNIHKRGTIFFCHSPELKNSRGTPADTQLNQQATVQETQGNTNNYNLMHGFHPSVCMRSFLPTYTHPCAHIHMHMCL